MRCRRTRCKLGGATGRRSRLLNSIEPSHGANLQHWLSSFSLRMVFVLHNDVVLVLFVAGNGFNIPWNDTLVGRVIFASFGSQLRDAVNKDE